MEVKWSNVVGFALLIFAFIMGIRMKNEITLFLGTMAQLGPANSTNDKIMGLIALGLVGVIIVGIIKILVQSQNRD